MALWVIVTTNGFSQTSTDESQKKFQAKPGPTQPMDAQDFGPSSKTTLHWMGMAGFMINSRGTILMVDPLLQDFDMPIMIDFPIKTKDVPKVDGVLVTHSDNDHFSIPTNRALQSVTTGFHSTLYVDSLMQNEGFPAHGHKIGDMFEIGATKITITPVDHAWQNAYPGASERIFKDKDSCGFWIETADGSIWATGDSRLMEEHLHMPTPDAILFDFSDSEWHFTLEGAIKLANTYPDSKLLLHHWGSVDAPDFAPFNGNPKDLYDKIVNPERIVVLAPGEPYVLQPLKKH
ncbi:hypothetical protein Musp01_27810 [Muricauda sp. NBRC 101325]|nr:hypothetical protein Musp01_27810 [Muricauda sp. NBRC 101325]